MVSEIVSHWILFTQFKKFEVLLKLNLKFANDAVAVVFGKANHIGHEIFYIVHYDVHKKKDFWTPLPSVTNVAKMSESLPK